MGKKKEKPAQSVTTTGVPPEYQQYFDQLVGGASNTFEKAFGASAPEMKLAGFTPNQTSAQGNIAALAQGPLKDFVNTLMGAGEYGLTSFLTPDSDVVQNAADSAIAPIMRAFSEQMLPAIEGEAVLAGGVGGSRQGIAERGAADVTSRNALETAAQVTNQAFQTGQDTYAKALALGPQTVQAGVFPDLALAGVGEQQQEQAQRELDISTANQSGDINAEQIALSNYANILFGLPFRQSTGTQQAASGGGGGVVGGIGGAMQGASLGMKLGGPWGGAIGGGLGLLTGIFG